MINFSELNIQLWEPGNNYYDSLVTVGALQQITPLNINEKILQSGFFNLYQNFPNPFNSSTTIKYELFKSGEVKIVIINFLGEDVRSIINKYHHVGENLIQWDGMDDQVINMASGIYFYKINLEEE